MSPTLDNLLSGGLGALVMWILTEGTAWWKDRSTAVECKRSIRQALSLEIERNIEELTALRKLIESRAGSACDTSETAESRKERLVQQFLQVPMPAWHHDAWTRLVADIPGRLSEEEMRLAHRHHALLDQLSRIRELVILLEERQRHASDTALTLQGRGSLHFPGEYLVFQKHAPELWDQFSNTHEDIVALGNPIV